MALEAPLPEFPWGRAEPSPRVVKRGGVRTCRFRSERGPIVDDFRNWVIKAA